MPTSGTRFESASGDTWIIESTGNVKATDEYGTVVAFERVTAATPSVADLQQLTGAYLSDDAETTFTATVEGTSLVLKRRPDASIRLTPLYKDAFSGSIGTVIFRRDGSGRVNALSVVQDRVWDMPFARRDAATTTAHP